MEYFVLQKMVAYQLRFPHERLHYANNSKEYDKMANKIENI